MSNDPTLTEEEVREPFDDLDRRLAGLGVEATIDVSADGPYQVKLSEGSALNFADAVTTTGVAYFMSEADWLDDLLILVHSEKQRLPRYGAHGQPGVVRVWPHSVSRRGRGYGHR